MHDEGARDASEVGRVMDGGYLMRAPCSGCGCMTGSVAEKNGQDTVRCARCNRHCYNAPRTETGKEQRSVTTVRNGIKPSTRFAVIERDGGRCWWCKSDGNLHVGHILSVKDAFAAGLTDDEINDEENLVAQCEECNLGQGARPTPLRVAILRARISFRRHKDVS